MSKPKKISVCPDKKFDHTDDSLMTCHGNPLNPIHVKVTQFLGGEYIEWEYGYAAGEIGHATRCHHMLIQNNDRFIDRLIFRTLKGRHHAFFFDVTEIFKAQMNGLDGYQKEEEKEGGGHAMSS